MKLKIILACIVITTVIIGAMWVKPVKAEEILIVGEPIPIEEMEKEEPAYTLCDVPMDADLQLWLFDYCEDKHISHYMIMAMCERESQYKADAVGDNGRSFGIMQIQEQWHTERMAELGCTDLLDARQNIIVGIDYLLELTEKNEDIGWVLMAYNGGMAYAYKQDKLSEYAEYILTRAEELEQMDERNGR